MQVFQQYWYVWLASAVMFVFLGFFFGGRMKKRKQWQKDAMKKAEEEKVLFSDLTSEIFDQTDTIDLTRAVIYHLEAREDKLFEDENYDGNIIPHLNHDELLIYTMFQIENILNKEGNIRPFFKDEPYVLFKPYYKEAFETFNCFEIVRLLQDCEKLNNVVENDLDDDFDDNGPYATYNFTDFTNELMALLRSSNIGVQMGEYIRAHKDSFIDKGE